MSTLFGCYVAAHLSQPLVYFPVVSVPTFTVHPGVARPPSPLMIIDNNVDDSDDDSDDDDDDEPPSVPLEQYRAWLGEFQEELIDLHWTFSRVHV